VSKQEREYALRAFVKYNDHQDGFRGVKTWRQLLPDLEAAINNSVNKK